MNDKKPRLREVFGKKGWGIVFISMFYFFIGSAITSDGLNTILPFFMKEYGLDSATPLTMWITIGGYTTFIGNLIFGIWGNKKGAKPVIVWGLIGNIVACLILANAVNITLYAIGMVLFVFTTCGVSGIGTGLLGANWFPTKKGQYMGYATMGVTVSGTLAPMGCNFLLNTFGTAGCFYTFAALIAVFVVLTIKFVYSNPEEVGAHPDNNPNMTLQDVEALNAKRKAYEASSKWTKGAILKSGFFWQMAIGWGLLGVGSFGLISQLSLAYIEFGHGINAFITLMACIFPVGFFCSWLCGWADDKWGTKAASIGCCIMLIVSQLVMALFGDNLVAMCIGTALLCGTLSGQNNTAMSIVQTKFGRFDFANAWTVFSMVYKAFTVAGLLVVSLLTDWLGNYHSSILACAGFTVIAIIFQATLNIECVGRNELD